MDYELAKQLKESGFPQIGKSRICYDKSGEFVYQSAYTDFFEGATDCYCPTLEELIEAVINFPKGKNMGFSSGDGGFVAWKRVVFENNGDDYKGTGSTPIEAVAKLWLELNKKE